MKNLQEVFDQIQEFKATRKEIGREYRDALLQAEGYEDLKEEIKKLRDKKKIMETEVQSQMGSRFETYEKAKLEIENLEQTLTDVALTNLMKGENINLRDKNDVKYEPTYKITFKKAE